MKPPGRYLKITFPGPLPGEFIIIARFGDSNHFLIKLDIDLEMNPPFDHMFPPKWPFFVQHNQYNHNFSWHVPIPGPYLHHIPIVFPPSTTPNGSALGPGNGSRRNLAPLPGFLARWMPTRKGRRQGHQGQANQIGSIPFTKRNGIISRCS